MSESINIDNRIALKNRNDRFVSFIRNNLTGTIIKFTVTPQNVSETTSANYTQQDIVGASTPRIVYSNTSATTMSLSLQNLTEDYLPAEFVDRGLRAYANAFKALAYPSYSASGIVSSPNATLVLGNRSISCVVTSVSIDWASYLRDQEFMACNISLNLLVTRDNVPGVTNIELGQ